MNGKGKEKMKNEDADEERDRFDIAKPPFIDAEGNYISESAYENWLKSASQGKRAADGLPIIDPEILALAFRVEEDPGSFGHFYLQMPTIPDPRTRPMAGYQLTSTTLEAVRQATKDDHLKKGVEQVAKTIKRETAEFVVIAADAEPLELVLHLPEIAHEKFVPYVFVESKEELGQACGLNKPVVACSVTRNKDNNLRLNTQQVKDEIERRLRWR